MYKVEDKIIDSFDLQKELNPEIFNKSGEMQPKVRRKLLFIAQTFLEYLGVPIKVKDITLTGSLAGLNYSDFSDIDLHIIYDPKQADMLPYVMRELFAAKQALFNKTYDPVVKGFDVELYYQSPVEKHASQNVYSVLRNKFIKQKQSRALPRIKANEIGDKADLYRKQVQHLQAKFQEGEDITDEIKYLKKKIKKARQDALQGSGEYSIGNLAFKYLRRDGTLELLKNLEDKSISKKLSLSEGMKGILRM